MIKFNPSEMLEYIRYIQQYATVQPRTYWCEFPFYTIITRARQKFCLGYRSEDLAYIDTITQRALDKHQAYLDRLARFPLEKAEYYLRLKESHGINSVRGLSEVTGEDWSYIARILRTLNLPEPVKDFLKSNKHNPAILSFFHLRKLLDIIRQSEERLQFVRFRELMAHLKHHRFQSPLFISSFKLSINVVPQLSLRKILVPGCYPA